MGGGSIRAVGSTGLELLGGYSFMGIVEQTNIQGEECVGVGELLSTLYHGISQSATVRIMFGGVGGLNRRHAACQAPFFSKQGGVGELGWLGNCWGN